MSDQIEKPKRQLISQASTSQVVNYGFPYSLKCKFRTRHGDEYAAVWTNNLVDQFKYKDAYILGRKHAKRGANRVVDGYQIQTKYFSNTEGALKKCFKNEKEFRFSQQIVEVPPEQYDQIVEEFQKYGVSSRQVKKGSASFSDCVSARKLFSSKGIYFDFLEGVLTEIVPIFIHGSLVFIIYKYVKERSPKEAYEKAVEKVIKSFSVRTLANLATQQVGRLNLKFVHEFVKFFFVSPFLSKENCKHYLIALNPRHVHATFKHARGQVAKIISGQLFYSAALVSIILAGDIIKYKRKRMTKRQFTKNLVCEIVGALSGIIGQTYGFCKKSYSYGSILGLLSGMVAYTVTKTVANILIKDDNQLMIEYFEKELKYFTSQEGDLFLQSDQRNHFIHFMAQNNSLNSEFFEEMINESNKEELIRRLIREQLPLFKDPKLSQERKSFISKLTNWF